MKHCLAGWLPGVLVALVMLATGTPAGAAGALDPSFGSSGKTLTDFAGRDEGAVAVAMQSDGKIVAAGTIDVPGNGGDFAVARYNTNGSLDTSFGTNGKVTTHISGDDILMDVVVHTDGKIVVSGQSVVGGWDQTITVVRYNANGTLDTSFDTDGTVMTDVGGQFDSGEALAVQADGKIVVAGASYDHRSLVRYNTNGSLDTSFDGDGKIYAYNGRHRDLVLQPDGKILVGGDIGNHPNYDYAVWRYNTNGTLDNTFGTSGLATVALNGNDQSYHMALQSDGKILLSGWTIPGGAAIVRFTSAGILDTGFGTGGKILEPLLVANGMMVQGDGRIVVCGGSNNDLTVVRYLANGSADPSFGANGWAIRPLSAGEDWAAEVVLQSDGKIVVAGVAHNGANKDFALARLLNTNTAPVAVDSQAAVTTGASTVIPLVASDPDSNILTYAVTGGPSHGTLSGSGASRTYTPTAGYTGPDSFTFSATDPDSASSTATVSIMVWPPMNFWPDRGPVGTVVTITGAGVGTATSVLFNGVTGIGFTRVSAVQVRATVPAGATTGPVRLVTPAGNRDSARPFILPPTITGINPTSAAPAATVTVTGTNFTPDCVVRFTAASGPMVVATRTVNSLTSLTATVPATAVTGKVSVTNLAGTAYAAFTVTGRGLQFTPAQGVIGSLIRLSGSGFTGATAVKFSGSSGRVNALYRVDTDGQITCQVPVGAVTGTIEVTLSGGSKVTSAASFTVLSRVTVSTVTVNSATGDITLLFTGRLNATEAADATNYTVQVGGSARTVNTAAYNSTSNTVVLSTGSAITSGASVQVGWTLLDAADLALGGSRTVTAP